MKKFLPAICVLFAVFGAGLIFLRRPQPHRAHAMEIAPPDALLFVHLPDLRRTAERWPETAIAHLWNEPEMQAFLAEPMEKMPMLRRIRGHMERLRLAGSREAFVAIVGFDGTTPKFVAGLNFSGSKSEVAALAAEPWAVWRKAWPSGRAELLHRAQWEIETYTAEQRMLAGSFHAGWYFLANDLAALEATLARCQGGRESGIGSAAALLRVASPLPDGLDVFVFARPDDIMERLSGALLGTKNSPAAHETESRIPLAWGVKLEGAQIRDVAFIAGMPGGGSPLARATQALTAPESLLYGAFVVPSRLDLSPATFPLLALFAVPPWLASSSESLSWASFNAAFGPECGLVLDWPAAADAPSLSFVLQVRDPVRAAEVVGSITEPSETGSAWQREERAGVTHFQAAADPQGGTTPALAMTPGFVVFGAHAHAVRAVATRMETSSADVTQGGSFHEIAARVSTPGVAFAYLDLRQLFERSYEALRPFLGMSLALSPETSPYFDAAKLPSAQAIARHLGPSVYSQTSRPEGIFVESVGSLSFSQTLAGLAAVAWSSATPLLRKQGESAANPGAGTPPAPGALPVATGEPGEKPAQSSRKYENDDKKSQLRSSHP